MLWKKVDKTKPVDPPEGYAWHVSTSVFTGARFVLELLPKRLMQEKVGNVWHYRHPSDVNSKKGYRMRAPATASVYFDHPRQILRSSKKALKKYEEYRREAAVYDLLKGSINDNP